MVRPAGVDGYVSSAGGPARWPDNCRPQIRVGANPWSADPLVSDTAALSNLVGGCCDAVLVRRRSASLLAQIEHEALDGSRPLAEVLRKCVALGGEAKSADLRDWASRELNGYRGTEAEIPDYREVTGALAVDLLNSVRQLKNMRISSWDLPDFAQEHFDESLKLHFSVRELESMLTDSDEGTLKLSPPGAADLAHIMNRTQAGSGEQIMSLHLLVSTTAIRGVLDRIRTILVQLVAEMRAILPAESETPSPEVADAAINVVVRGSKRTNVQVVTSESAGGNSHVVASHGKSNSDDDGGFWTKAKLVGAVTVGVATVAATLVGIAQWQQWSPF